MTPLGVACGGREVNKLETLVRKSLTLKSTDAEQAMRRLSGAQAAAATVPEQCPIVETILEAGADLNTGIGTLGASPLMCAAGLGHVNVVRCLLSRGAELDKRDSKGATALIKAATLGNRDCVELLLNAGADKDIADQEGVSPVMAAVAAGDSDTLWALLAAGASPNGFRNTDGASPLHVAAAAGRRDLVSALVTCGADPNVLNNDGETPVLLASALGRIEVVKALGKSPACLKTKNSKGWTPLMVALSKGHVDVANALLDSRRELEVNARSPKTGATALSLALALEEKAGCLLYRLMVSGADPFALAGRRATPKPHCGTEKIENQGQISSSEERKSVEALEDVFEKDERVKTTVDEQEMMPAMCALAAPLQGVGMDKILAVC